MKAKTKPKATLSALHTDVLILGAGLAGLTTAARLGPSDYRVVEKSPSYGGLCSSEYKNGYTFDRTGHWLHLHSAASKRFVFSLLQDAAYMQVARRAMVFSHGIFTRFPFQAHTYGLPAKVVEECVLGFIEAHYASDRKDAQENFQQWILSHFGRGIATHFMIPYNQKLWQRHPRYLSADWCDTYIAKPTLSDVVHGAITPDDSTLGYNAHFYYPRQGGIATLTTRIYEQTKAANYLFSAYPVRIDAAAHTACLDNGQRIVYRHLVSTIPLPELLVAIQCRQTESLRDSAARLQWLAVDYVNIGLRHSVPTPLHWAYVPEPQIAFYRCGFPAHVHADLAPVNRTSIVTEFSRRGGSPRRRSQDSINGLAQMGIDAKTDAIEFCDEHTIPYAYVVYHAQYASDMARTAKILSRYNIHLIGRYGKWNYSAMEDAILDGIALAKELKNG